MGDGTVKHPIFPDDWEPPSAALRPRFASHSVGPGRPPSPRDEPTAYAIWIALVRVRDAFDWADVARDVEEQLRHVGIVTPAHDRLSEVERERDALIASNNALRWQWQAREAREARQ